MSVLVNPPFLIPPPIPYLTTLDPGDTIQTVNSIIRQLNVLSKASIITATMYQSARTSVPGSGVPTAVNFNSFFDETSAAISLALSTSKIFIPDGLRLVRLNAYAAWNPTSDQNQRSLYIVKNGATATPISIVTNARPAGGSTIALGSSLVTAWLQAVDNDFYQLFAVNSDGPGQFLAGNADLGGGPRFSAEFKP